LQLIIGHVGESLPYGSPAPAASSLTPRRTSQPVAITSIQHSLDHSGYFTLPPWLRLEVVGIDRLLFSVDYPYSPNSRGRALLDSLPEILGEEDLLKLTIAMRAPAVCAPRLRFAHGSYNEATV